jgi:MFS family permease
MIRSSGPVAGHRRARLGVSLVFAVCGAAFATWAARIPAAQERLGLSDGQLAVGLFGLAGGSVLALLAAAPLITVIGSRAASAVGAVVLCGSLPLVAAAPGPELFVAALVLLGVGNSLLDVTMNAHAARVEAAYGRPIFASFHAYWNVGGLLGSGAGALAAQVPLTTHFGWAAGLLLATALLAVGSLFLGGPDQGQGGSAFGLPGRALLPLGAIAFCGFVAEGTVNDWSAVHLTGVSGATPAAASLAYFAFSLTMIAVRLVADRVTARAGAVAVARAAALVTLTGFALVTAVPHPAAGVAGFAVVGLGVAAIVPLAWSIASQQHPDAPGRAIAAVATCGYLGFLVGPVLVGALAEAVGLRWSVAAAGATVAAVLLLAPSLRPGVPTGRSGR